LLTAEVDVPAQTKEGGYDVNLACRSGSTASASLWVGSKGPTAEPSMGPHTGGGFLANRGRSGLTGPAIWLIGGAGALVAAGALGAITVRRRRHRPAR
jgi:MYXO-CTERM domain-containing protein